MRGLADAQLVAAAQLVVIAGTPFSRVAMDDCQTTLDQANSMRFFISPGSYTFSVRHVLIEVKADRP
jgi:hypothetical protein